MALPQIIDLLRQTVGLDVASVGLSLIERAVKQRLIANDLPDVLQYADLLQNSKLELQSLVEAVVIPETFFFRYPESFAALKQIVGERFLSGLAKIRVLSVPCSTGEEPYSIAMTLLDGGVSANRIQIDASDISARALDFARFGIFGSNSFRGSDLQFRDQYFQKAGSVFRLCDRVRQLVKFEQGNLLEEGFRFGSEPYEIIFCRNLLIYFDPATQGLALQSLKQFLNLDGLLFVGAAETGVLTQHGFSSVKLPMSFAFRKSEPLTCAPPPKLKRPKVRSPAKSGRGEANRKTDSANSKKALPELAEHENRRIADMALAEQLADKGQLREAAETCEYFLREHGPSARAFHLLGLIRDGAGDQQQASEFYRKALYLEPDHYDALIHLALLKDRSGDEAAAKTLKSRARRVLERTK
jgi:chemotaxis protein methyltransferase WspC